MRWDRDGTFIRTAALLAAFACAVTVVSAAPQDALGSGNALGRDTTMRQKHGQHAGALDANSQVGAGRVNTSAPKTDYYSRNLIVTGDVAGGRGFRGSVGYREQSEFTGATGADVNRRWDAYSATSSPLAIRANFDPYKATQEYGAVLYTRSYSNAAARDILTNQQPLDARIAFDQFAATGSKMSRQADIIDAANTRDTAMRQDWRVEGKSADTGPLSGSGAASNAQSGAITGPPVDAMLSRLGLSTYERQMLKEDVLQGRTNAALVGQAYDDKAMWRPETLGDVQRLRPVLPREYDTVIDTMRQRAGMEKSALRPERGNDVGTKPGAELTSRPNPDKPLAEPGTKPGTDIGSRPSTEPSTTPGANVPEGTLDKQLEWLRYQLERSGPDATAPSSLDGEPGGTQLTPSEILKGAKDAGTPRNAETVEVMKPREDEPKPGEAPKPKRVDIDELSKVLKHGRQMDSLVPEDAGYIHDMMDIAAQAMRQGEFFRAEQLYSSVLRVIPGHPLALAGIANSNLGAGLPWASALTLRKLFAAHPEMIGTRFGPEVLPTAARMESGLATARQRLRAASAPDAGPKLAADRYDYGLVIAYTGFQQNNPEIVREGLAAMKATNPSDPLVKVLEHVWLPDEPAPAATQPEAQPAP